ncbi:MAG: hypothetical protein RL119_573, partial [Actinomycetota bacterium]
MTMPEVGPGGIGIIETMMGFPDPDPRRLYEFFRGNIRDKESSATMFPVEYLFKQNVPGALPENMDPVEVAINTMDHFGIERSMIGIEGEPGVRALSDFPARFIPSCNADANGGLDEVRKIRRLHDEHGLRAVGTFPAGCTPQVPIDHARWYPIYSVCAELGIPIFICAGIPGPRVPSMCQKVELLDVVCYDFPELKIVTRHGCQPWTELAVKLMLKWPNLYYSTSAFAPKHYDPRIIDYANSRGADRVIYAGYWPMGLTYE